jgi:hypothetical protein
MGGIGGASMSKFVKYFAVLALIAGAIALTPNVASAQRHGGWHGGMHHGGGWYGGGGDRGGGWHGGWRGGWGWAPGSVLGFDWGYPYYGGSYYYAPAPDCGWVRVRVWQRGRWLLRRAWRCW